MATTRITAPGGEAAEKFLRERFGLEWGEDVFGVEEDGFTAESVSADQGLFKLTLVGRCTRADVEKFIALLWSKSAPDLNPENT